MSLSRQILVALVAGVALGLFFGEKVAFLSIGGRAFVQLLQITTGGYYGLDRSGDTSFSGGGGYFGLYKDLLPSIVGIGVSGEGAPLA